MTLSVADIPVSSFSPKPVQRLPKSRIPTWSPAGPVPVPSSCPFPAPLGFHLASRDQADSQPSTSAASEEFTTTTCPEDLPAVSPLVLPVVEVTTGQLPDSADNSLSLPAEVALDPAGEGVEISTCILGIDSPAEIPAAAEFESTAQDPAPTFSNIVNHTVAPSSTDPIAEQSITNLDFSALNFNDSVSLAASQDLFPALELSGDIECLSSDFNNIENFIF